MQRTRCIARWIEHPDQRPASDGIGVVLDQHTGQGDTYGAGATIPHQCRECRERAFDLIVAISNRRCRDGEEGGREPPVIRRCALV